MSAGWGPRRILIEHLKESGADLRGGAYDIRRAPPSVAVTDFGERDRNIFIAFDSEQLSPHGTSKAIMGFLATMPLSTRAAERREFDDETLDEMRDDLMTLRDSIAGAAFSDGQSAALSPAIDTYFEEFMDAGFNIQGVRMVFGLSF